MKSLIPPLVAAYIDLLRTPSRPKTRKGYVPLSHAICQVLNLFCKVRGEKVIKGFLNNEPRFLEPILAEFEAGKNYAVVDNEPLHQWIVPWTERYILLLWLSHLMLAPFPLASISASQPSHEMSTVLGVELPPEMPGVALRVLSICVTGLQSASKERGAAANLLIRLCVRPDMQKLGLLHILIKWSLPLLFRASEIDSDIHQCLGVLSFLSGLVSSATNEEIGPFLPVIYQSSQNIISQANLAFVKSSAVARKLIIKTLRSIVLHCVQAGETVHGLDTTAVLEETIEFLLESVADGDTPVRYAASKALSIITMKLDPGMANDVAEAILGSLNEDIFWSGSKRNLSRVNPLRWHGLTLTLSHLLYRRALSTEQLPEILNALLLALAFEQRSTTGGSLGTNVRDAACFGIWALARRYTTEELCAVETSSVRVAEHRMGISLIQVLAIELVVVACLDPAGNIRRGSSAALQELIGRHPNTVASGIPLVQIVDFHAVGLRDRAMCEVSLEASRLSPLYWDALFMNLLEWRGTGSLDSPSRLSAARAIGLLSINQEIGRAHSMASEICSALKLLKPREVEERQGLVSALSCLLDQTHSLYESGATGNDHKDLIQLWHLLDGDLDLDNRSFTDKTLRPELTASSMCNFLGSLATVTYRKAKISQIPKVPTDALIRLFNLCLGRHADSVLDAIPRATRGILKLLDTTSPSDANNLVADWLLRLENEASYNGLRWSGFAVALGAAFSFLGEVATGSGPTATQIRITDILTFRCSSAVAIEPRTVALLAISILFKNASETNPPTTLDPAIRDKIASALHTALNDYTVTDRGDVGSLVRLEALSTIGAAWETDLLSGSKHTEDLHADVLRLSLEKLDKVRLRAAQVLEKGSYEHFETVAKGAVDGISSYAYFANALTVLHSSTPKAIQEAVALGFVTSAGLGSESVVQNSRAALLDAVDSWPIREVTGPEGSCTLLEFATCFLDLLKRNLETERVLLPLLEVLAFLFDMQVLQRLMLTPFK